MKSKIWITMSVLRYGFHRQEVPRSKCVALNFATEIVIHFFREDVLASSIFNQRPQNTSEGAVVLAKN